MRQKSEILEDLKSLSKIINDLKISNGNLENVAEQNLTENQKKLKSLLLSREERRNLEIDTLLIQIKNSEKLCISSSDAVAEELDEIYRGHLSEANTICSKVINFAIAEGVEESKEIAPEGLSPLKTLAFQIENLQNSVSKRNIKYVEELTSRKKKLGKLPNTASKIQEIEHYIDEIINNPTALTLKTKRFIALKKYNAVVTIEDGALKPTQTYIGMNQIAIQNILNMQSVSARRTQQAEAESAEPIPVMPEPKLVMPVITPEPLTESVVTPEPVTTTPEIEIPAKPEAEIEQKFVANNLSMKEQYIININKKNSDVQEYAQICRDLSFTQAELDELCLDDPFIAAYYKKFEAATKACEKLISEIQKLMNSPDLNTNPQDFYPIILDKAAALYTLSTDPKRSQLKLAIIEKQNSLNPLPGSPERIKIEANINAYKNNRIEKLMRENSEGILKGFHPLPTSTATFERTILNNQSPELRTLREELQKLEEDRKDPAYRRKTELNIEKDSFVDSLRLFLKPICKMHLANDGDKNTRIFVETLIKKLHQISAKLQKDNLPFNVEKVADFYQGLIKQLATKKPLFQPNEIEQFLTDLTTATTSTASAVMSMLTTDSQDLILKKQIIALRAFNPILVRLTKKTRHDYRIIKAFQDAENPTLIIQKCAELKTHFQDLKQKLIAKMALLPKIKLTEAKELLKHFETVDSILDKSLENSTNAMNELAYKNPGLDASLKEKVSHAKLIEAMQKNALDKLNTYQTEVSKRHNGVMLGLVLCYNGQKKIIIEKLQKAIADADITLSLVFNAAQVSERLSEAKKDLDILIKDPSALTIDSIEACATEHVNYLLGQIRHTQIALQVKASRKLTTLKQPTRKFQRSEANPCNDELIRLRQELTKAIAAADSAYHFHYVVGLITQDGKAAFKAVLAKANEAKQKYQTALNIAEEVEARIQSKEYKTSLTIMNDLDSEFMRIFDKKTQKKSTQNTIKIIESESECEYEENSSDYASESGQDSDIVFNSVPSVESDSEEFELINLPENRGRLFLSKNSLDNAEVKALNAIDPRLVKLWKIRNDFSEANCDYINKNLDFKELLLKRMTDDFVAAFNHQLKFYRRPVEDNSLLRMTLNPSLCINQSDEVFNSYKLLLNDINPSLIDLCMEIRKFDNTYQPEKPGQCYVDVLFNKIKSHLHNDKIENISDSQNSAFTQFLRVYVFKPWREFKQWANSLISDSKHYFFTTFGATKTEAILVNAGNEAAVSLEEIQADRENSERKALKL